MTGPADTSDDDRAPPKAGHDVTLAEAATRLFAGQAATLAMMTAYGFSLTSRMTGAMLGAMADAVEKGRTEGAPVDAPAAEPQPRVVALKVVRNDPVPAARRKRPASPVASRPAPAKTKPAAPAAYDDLKRISGIGPKLEKVLNSMGITRLADLAAMSENDMRTLDARLGLENRIIRDDWAGQAKALLEG